MINYILQITIWIGSYFLVGKSGYLEKAESIIKVSIFRSGLFLAISFFLNGMTDLIFVTVLPAVAIFGINYFCEPRIKGKAGLFTLTIVLQILIVVAAFICKDIFKYNYYDIIYSAKADKQLIFKLFSVIVCLTPANLIIRVILDKYLSPSSGINEPTESMKLTPNNEEDQQQDSLQRAGRLIGNIERILTLGLLFAGQYEAIGFLIAAKSIIRTRDRKADSEYILIGTLLSFGFAILIGLLIQHLIQL